MHSAILRGSDFKVKSHGLEIHLHGYCKLFTTSTKIGIFTPHGNDAIGATNLILLFVTAFYDILRKRGKDFHEYPKFYTFQSGDKLTDYAMFDIYPKEKNILIEDDLQSFINEVRNKQINILIIPEEHNFISKLSEDQLAIIKESVNKCYLYSESGEVQNPNLEIETNHPEISEWIYAVQLTHDNAYVPPTGKTYNLTQQFQDIKIDY